MQLSFTSNTPNIKILIKMASSPGTYLANQPYNQADVYQPHPTILEPADFDSENGMLKLSYRPFQLSATTYGNPALLRAISLTRLTPIAYAASKYSWKYDSRHKAQSILPFLYLGPAPIARDAAYIRDNRITMVIAVRSAQSARAQPKWLDPSRFASCIDIKTATFDVDGPYDLITRIKPILKLMTDHLESNTSTNSINTLNDIGGRILVFCESGNDRSPVLVAAYLMLVFGITWHESLNLIHAFRFSVSLNGSMNDMLKTLEEMLRAESDTAAVYMEMQTSQVISVEKRKPKRTLDDAYDSDETMTDENEVATRPGIAPFIDVT